MHNHLLGYDFGTTAVKVALVRRDGVIVASTSEPYPTLMPQPGWAEQGPDEWWQAMVTATRRLLTPGRVDTSSIGALGLTAQMSGTLPVDRDGHALHNALIWFDTRSAMIAQRMVGGFPAIKGYGLLPLLRWLRLTNGAPNRSGKDPLSKMVWLREQHPDIWAQTHKLLDVKDYLLFRLGGGYVTSPDLAHLTWLFDTRPGHCHWSPTLTRRYGISTSQLPQVAHACESAATLTTTAANALGLPPGLALNVGVGDVAAYALAAGDIADGAIHAHLGTGSWVAAHLPRRAVDIFTNVGTLCAAEVGRYLVVGAQESAGSCVAWAARHLGFERTETGEPDFAAFDAAAARSSAGANGLLFLPWLFGERVPVDDRHLRGGYLNLSLTHDRADLARAVLEGVALNLRWALAPVERITATQGSVRLLGGGATSDLWCQIVADVFQRPVEQLEQPALGGCRGAAMTAAVSIGWYPNLQAATAMCRVRRRFAHDPNLGTLYANRYHALTAHYRHNRHWYQRYSNQP